MTMRCMGAVSGRRLLVLIAIILCLHVSLVRGDGESSNSSAEGKDAVKAQSDNNSNNNTPSRSVDEGTGNSDSKDAQARQDKGSSDLKIVVPSETDSTSKDGESSKDKGGNEFGISLGNGDSKDSSKDDSKGGKGSKPTASGSRLANGQPGRITMKTPPQAIESPLFEINSKVELKWDYDKNMKSPPSKITIRGQMPNGYTQPGTNKPLYWYIAKSVNAGPKSYKWDTVTESPPGYSLTEGTGYRLYIYDSDIGWDNSTHVYPGKLFQFMLPFSMYHSRYANTNDGVPSNYNPNASDRSVSSAAGMLMAVAISLVTAITLSV